MSENAEAMRQLASEMDRPGLELMAQVLNKSLQETHATGQMLHEIIEGQLKRARAELLLVREAIHELHSHRWMPQPNKVLAALYPTDEDIKRAMEEAKHDAQG